MKYFKLATCFLFTFFSLPSLMSQYQSLYATIPNYIKSANEEAITNTDGILRIEKVSEPAFQYFRAAKDDQKRPCVIICPGGGYRILAAAHEGTEVATFFNSIGVNAIVLKYRIPNAQHQIDPSIAPLQDAQQAIYLARKNAIEWGIDANKIGIMGFSAGGHVASSLAVHYNDVKIELNENISLRPNFQILIYPVITFNSYGHMGSRNNLLKFPLLEDEIHYFSNEENVTSMTPPAFIIHAKDDKTVPVANSTNYFQALQSNQIPAEIYLFEKGGHGFGMKNKSSDVYWPNLLEKWMQSTHIIDK